MFNLLIVDDDMATVEVIRDSIAWGDLQIGEVYVAYNVVGAKAILLDKDIDIVISDIEMPQESGIDLLKWVREEAKQCEFLLLTCHENFTYAFDAISFNVSAYLTKPFNIEIMVANIKKITNKLMDERKLKKSSKYGEWVEKNLRIMRLNFLKELLEGEITESNNIVKQIERRHLDFSVNKKYCFIYTQVVNIEDDVEKYGKSVLEFIIEGYHSEIVLDRVENDSVVHIHSNRGLSFITICDAGTQNDLMKRCKLLVDEWEKHFKCTLNCCISNDYAIYEITNAKVAIEKGFYYNVISNKNIFFEWEVKPPVDQNIQILNIDEFTKLIEKKDKNQILHYLKGVLRELKEYQNLNAHSLYLIKQEIIQVVYADLLKQGIQATKLFYDEISIGMADRATDSIVDLIRWVNYLLERTFAYKEEISKSATLIDKINEYIAENYMYKIGRNEIAGVFYLTPEYLAKLYKKKTGITVKEYINEHRINKAKELLSNKEINISNIAEEVGFESFSYFSTVFKKSTGLSPKEYRNC